MAPLGLARAVLTSGVAPSAATSQGFTTGAIGADNEGGASNANHAYAQIDPNDGGNNHTNSADVSIVTWFRGLPGDMNGGDFGMIWQFVRGDMASSGTRTIEVYIDRTSSNKKFNAFFICGGASRTATKDYSDNATLDAALLDGEWHCIMLRISGTGANCEFYLDGVDQSISHPANASGTIDLDDSDAEWNMSAFSGAFGGAGAAWDIGPTWIYDTAIDFTDSSVRAFYFNASNTDGYVDGGEQGTSGGATRPDLYLYNEGSGLENGGNLTATIRDITNGSGTVTDNDNTNGPGSGNTRSSANP